uniref:Uncharacterized protein n=1 Tax=viral metagenome TaxID=1070528 RepID=A0A6C0HAB7_9ZZZZ
MMINNNYFIFNIIINNYVKNKIIIICLLLYDYKYK